MGMPKVLKHFNCFCRRFVNYVGEMEEVVRLKLTQDGAE